VSVYLVLKMAVADGTDATRLAAIRRLMSSGVRELLRAHEAEGTIAPGEIMCGDFASVLAEREEGRTQAKPQAWRSLRGTDRDEAEAGVRQVREALDDVANGASARKKAAE
jgi:hypothetical protein